MALYGYRPAWEQLDPRDEATRWLLGGEKAKALLEDTPYEPGELLRSKAFPDGGYYVMRGHDAGEGAYLIFDCGPFGFEQSPVHAHSDALAFELACHGTTVMMDPGSYSTKLETTWRNFFRGTAAHNTVTIDGQDQTILFERNRSNRPARCRTHRWCSGNDFDFVDGSHDGYLRLSDPVRHRRQIFYLKGQYWVVGDFIDGSGSHACDINFHFTEDSTLHVSETDASVRVDKPGFPAFNIFPYSRADFTSTVIAGEIEPIQGWISYYSGSKLPAPVLQYRICGSAPLEFFSILLPHREPGYELSGICEVPVTVDQSVRSQKNNIAAISFKLDKFVDILISDRNETPIDKQFLGFSTDAAVAYLRCDSRRRIAYRAATVGGRYIRFGDTDLPGSMMCHPDFLFEQH